MLQLSNIQILLINKIIILIKKSVSVWFLLSDTFFFDANERVTTSFTGYVGFFNLYPYTRKRSLFIYFALYYFHVKEKKMVLTNQNKNNKKKK